MDKIKKHENNKWYKKGLKAGIPIALGYFAVAFTLGIQAQKIGITAPQSSVASASLLASAGEYIAFSLMGSGASILMLALMEVVTNARYLLMSCALSQKIPEDTPLRQRLLMGYCVTDEIFSAAISVKGHLNPYYMYGMVSVAAPGWTIGTALGVLLGNALPSNVVSALSVGLFGMFIACIIPESKKNKIVGVVIVISFACSYVVSRIKAFDVIPDGIKIIALTIIISLVATLIHPVEGKELEE